MSITPRTKGAPTQSRIQNGLRRRVQAGILAGTLVALLGLAPAAAAAELTFRVVNKSDCPIRVDYQHKYADPDLNRQSKVVMPGKQASFVEKGKGLHTGVYKLYFWLPNENPKTAKATYYGTGELNFSLDTDTMTWGPRDFQKKLWGRYIDVDNWKTKSNDQRKVLRVKNGG